MLHNGKKLHISKKDEDINVLLVYDEKKNYKFNFKKPKTISISDFFNGLKNFGDSKVIIKKLKLDNNILKIDIIAIKTIHNEDMSIEEHIEITLENDLRSDSEFMTQIVKIVKDYEERKDEIELLGQKREISFYEEKSNLEIANNLFKRFIKYSSIDEVSYNQMLKYYFCLQDDKEKIIKDNIEANTIKPLEYFFKLSGILKWPVIAAVIYACLDWFSIYEPIRLVIYYLSLFIVSGCLKVGSNLLVKKALTDKMDILIEEIELEYGFSKKMEKGKNDDLLVTYLLDDMNYAKTHQKEELPSIISLFKEYNLQEKGRVYHSVPYEDVIIKFKYFNELTVMEENLYSKADIDTIMKVMDKLVADIDKRLAFLGLHNYDNKCVILTKQIIEFLNGNPYEGYEKDILKLFYLLQSYVIDVVTEEDIAFLRSEEKLFSFIKEVVHKFQYLAAHAKHNEGKWEKCFNLLNLLYAGTEERPEYDNDQELKYPGITSKQE